KAKEALKFNRVDILVENDKKELIIIELQNCNEVDYFFRMLFGVSKAISDHLETGDSYIKVRKIYHVNIVYFELGQGVDYVYHGSTEFRGIHCNDILKLNTKQQQLFSKEAVSELYPEYYILRVEDFNGIAKDSLDEWIYFLKTNDIPEEFTAPGLPEARKALQFYKLSDEEKSNYVFHLDQSRYEQNVITDSIEKGITIGMTKGSEQTRINTAVKLSKRGMSIADIADITDLTPEQVTAIIDTTR
ncbi:MAG: Rpn family recombination-promoting nuclease/putative transposase, partial [Bacteroidales bacterium]|nr:Rpn family recombination-promoting nuclease/putative transposase [Bacteroidales bacterium]